MYCDSLEDKTGTQKCHSLTYFAKISHTDQKYFAPRQFNSYGHDFSVMAKDVFILISLYVATGHKSLKMPKNRETKIPDQRDENRRFFKHIYLKKM
jgi:hypothetical protein